MATTVGNIGGGLAMGGALAKSGLSFGEKAATAGAGLAKVAGGSAVDGAIMGGIAGFGSGEGVQDRVAGAVLGGGTGLALGGAIPLGIAALPAAVKSAGAIVGARVAPDAYARDALATTLQRAKMTPQQVAQALTAARADGQGMFTVADALGDQGARRLGSVYRAQSDASSGVAETLQRRQAGQGRRITTALEEGFNAPDTAAERALSLKAARDLTADEGYSAARRGAGAVDVTGAIKSIDKVLQPGISRFASPQTNIADDSVEGALRRARAMLTDGRSNVSDFTVALRAKQDMDDMIGAAVRAGANNRARLLTQVRNELDRALSSASPAYASARNAFRQGSREIEAVDTGAQAAMRGRSEDTIGRFRVMSPAEKAAFRAGYADKMIENTQGAAMGTNKTRSLVNDATEAEFQAFAAPGRGDQLGNRIAREQRMFETRQGVLGNSMTAQRLGDDADFAKFDPSVVATLLRGKPVSAAIEATTRFLTKELGGMQPSVAERLAKTLLSSDPNVALSLLHSAYTGRQMSDKVREVIRRLLVTSGATQAGQAF